MAVFAGNGIPDPKSWEARPTSVVRGGITEQYVTELPADWGMRLSHWKMQNDIHTITEYQAKRFAKSLM